MLIVIEPKQLCTHNVPFRVYKDKAQTQEVNPGWAVSLVDHIHKAFAYGSKGQLCWRDSQLPPSVQLMLRKHTIVFKGGLDG